MKFPYQPRPVEATPLVEGEVVHRPLVPVHLITIRDVAFVWALADTGADHTLLPFSVMKEIGVPFEAYDDEATIVRGFGGSEVSVIPGDVDMVIRSGEQRFQWSARVGIVKFTDPADEMAVLGHGGFFEFFAATFDPSSKELSLVPTSAFPGTVDG